MMGILFATAYLGRILGANQAWRVVFTIGASTAATYLVFALLTLLERTRKLIFYTSMKTRIILLALTFAPTLGGVEYWIQQEGSVESLPIFPAFIIIFYGWILLQAYFIAAPVSQLLTRIERGIIGEGHAKKLARALGTTLLFLPAAPLVYGVWAISSWLSSTYQNVQDANGKIITWTIAVIVILLFTYFLTIRWGWKSIKQKAPQAAIFAGGTFLVLWGYLLYRATMIGIGYVTQNQPSNPLLDAGLVVVSIVGAMQTFARKTIGRADHGWSQLLPFIVFAFGSVYAVAQFYFTLRVALTRADLSIAVNTTVFATGLITMMYLIRKHLLTTGSTPMLQGMQPQVPQAQPISEPLPTRGARRSFFRLPWPKRKTKPPKEEASQQTSPDSQAGPGAEQNASANLQHQKQQTDVEEAASLKNDVQQFLDENQQGPEAEEAQPMEQNEGQAEEESSEDSSDPDY